jgi:hypothetical protein
MSVLKERKTKLLAGNPALQERLAARRRHAYQIAGDKQNDLDQSAVRQKRDRKPVIFHFITKSRISARISKKFTRQTSFRRGGTSKIL